MYTICTTLSFCYHPIFPSKLGNSALLLKEQRAAPRSVMWLASLTTFTKTCNGEKRKGKNQMHIQASYIACVYMSNRSNAKNLPNIQSKLPPKIWWCWEINWNVWFFFRLFIRVGGGSSLKNFDCFLFWFLDEVDDWAIQTCHSLLRDHQTTSPYRESNKFLSSISRFLDIKNW